MGNQIHTKGAYLSRRDFLKAAGVVAGSLVLDACAPVTNFFTPKPTPGPNELTIGVKRGEKQSTEQLLSGSAGEYRILTVDPNSIKSQLSGNPQTDADRKLQEQQNATNNTLDKVQAIKILQRKDDKNNWQDVLLPSSQMSRGAIEGWTSYFDAYFQPSFAMNDAQKIKAKADFLSTIFDPQMSGPEKMAEITKNVAIPAQLTQQLTDNLTRISTLSGNIPDNVPWDFLFDSYVAASKMDVTVGLDDVAQQTGTAFGIFIPKDSEAEQTKAEVGKMFIPIHTLVKPQIFATNYEVETAPTSADGSTPPKHEKRARLNVFYGPKDERNRSIDTIPHELDKILSVDLVTLPDDVFLQIDNSNPNIDVSSVSSRQIDPSHIDFGFIPKGMDPNKGTIEPVVFLNDPEEIRRSRVFVPGSISSFLDIPNTGMIERVNWGNKSWVTKVTSAVESLQKLGATDAFKYGLLTPKGAFGRMFKGRMDTTQNQVQYANLALLPDDQKMMNALAVLFTQGKTFDQWGVPIDFAQNNTEVLAVKEFEGTENPLNIMESLKWNGETGRLKPGELYNISDILDVGGKHVVAFSDTTDGFISQTVKGSGNDLNDLLDTVMVVGTKDEFIETTKVLGNMIPWALIAVAAVIQPETLGTNLWRVLTWVAARLPLLTLGG